MRAHIGRVTVSPTVAGATRCVIALLPEEEADVPELVPEAEPGPRLRIPESHGTTPGHGLRHQEPGRPGLVQPGPQPVHHPDPSPPRSDAATGSVQPSAARPGRPPRRPTQSSAPPRSPPPGPARPPPVSRSPAAPWRSAPRTDRSGYGGSCPSCEATCEATPACRVGGANCTPGPRGPPDRATSATVMGRPAPGISADPAPSAPAQRRPSGTPTATGPAPCPRTGSASRTPAAARARPAGRAGPTTAGPSLRRGLLQVQAPPARSTAAPAGSPGARSPAGRAGSPPQRLAAPGRATRWNVRYIQSLPFRVQIAVPPPAHRPSPAPGPAPCPAPAHRTAPPGSAGLPRPFPRPCTARSATAGNRSATGRSSPAAVCFGVAGPDRPSNGSADAVVRVRTGPGPAHPTRSRGSSTAGNPAARSPPTSSRTPRPPRRSRGRPDPPRHPSGRLDEPRQSHPVDLEGLPQPVQPARPAPAPRPAPPGGPARRRGHVRPRPGNTAAAPPRPPGDHPARAPGPRPRPRPADRFRRSTPRVR